MYHISLPITKNTIHDAQSLFNKAREYIPLYFLIKLEEINKENRVLDLLKHVLQSRLRSVVGRWHKHARAMVHERKLKAAEELYTQGSRKLQDSYNFIRIHSWRQSVPVMYAAYGMFLPRFQWFVYCHYTYFFFCCCC